MFSYSGWLGLARATRNNHIYATITCELADKIMGVWLIVTWFDQISMFKC